MRQYQFKLKTTDRLLATDEWFTDRFIAAACLTLPNVYLAGYEPRKSPVTGRPVVAFHLTSNELTIRYHGDERPYFPARVQQFFDRDPDFPVVPGDNRDALDQLMDIITKTIRLAPNPIIVAEAEIAEDK